MNVSTLPTFQITLAGYKAERSDTDHLIKWVNAPSISAVLRYAHVKNWALQEPIDAIAPRSNVEVDAVLDETGAALREASTATAAAPSIAVDVDEDAVFEGFRDQVRNAVIDSLDQAMIDIGIPRGPSDNLYNIPRAYLLGTRDADLPRLFEAIDRQAELLWERGAGKHLIAQKRKELSR